MNSDLSVIRERGFNALAKELGVTGMAIFIRLFENGSCDYTEERECIVGNSKLWSAILEN